MKLKFNQLNRIGQARCSNQLGPFVRRHTGGSNQLRQYFGSTLGSRT